MASFIHDVLIHLQQKSVDFSQLTFVLPSKRAGTFLKHDLSRVSTKPLFSPVIISIEEFVEELSQLQKIPNLELLFEFYEVYCLTTPEDQRDNFDSFLKWAQILLQDFNEIDRYLIDPKHIFDYLSAIKDINHWSVEENQTPLIKHYLSFWKNLNSYYTNLSEHLIEKGKGYQGLIYREAVENLENYIQSNSDKQHIFVGFNALNNAETRIIQELLHSDMANIFWDIDQTFLDHEIHDAGHFIRKYKNNWRYFNTNAFQWAHDYYSEEKNVNVIGTPKNVGQAKFVGELLNTLKSKNPSLQKTALVLGNENLLIPVLNSIPKSIEALNVTMGLSLDAIPLASLFETLFLMNIDRKSTCYFKDVIEVLSHPFIKSLFDSESGNNAEKLISSIQKNNLIFLSKDKLLDVSKNHETEIILLFESWNNNPSLGLEKCQRLILHIKQHLDQNKKDNLLALEYLYKFNEIFNSLIELNTKHRKIQSLKILFELYKEILQSETLDFQGEPLQGLQIMGMLESRVLDFDTVIIASVNEGILPSGKSNNSFIPFDVKLENGLPTFKEKDAVYTYHFYRLLQRAKNIYIIYNTEPDTLNAGEKSRFITQLEIENIHNLNQIIVSPGLPKLNLKLRRMQKNDAIMSRIEKVFKKGVSPSSLLTYIRNPFDYYAEKILGIKEYDDVEEVVAANTLGTVIHETLRELYKPTLGSFLTEEMIKGMSLKTNECIEKHFKIFYKEGDMKKGKNFIILEIAKHYVQKFLKSEQLSLQQGNTIKILELESDVRTAMTIEGVSFPVTLNGQIDRIDEFNGVVRIIDYKTGKVLQNQVEIVDWELLTTDYDKFGKSFQILMYASILNNNKPFQKPIEAGVISFKNLSAGFLKFQKKDKMGAGAHKESLITPDTIDGFNKELNKLILEIYNSEIDFIEKEI